MLSLVNYQRQVAAVLPGCQDGLVGLDMAPQPRHFAIWRSTAGASVKPLSPRASVFLQAVLAKSDVSEALRQSTGRSTYGRAAAALYDEIASNSFALISRASELRSLTLRATRT